MDILGAGMQASAVDYFYGRISRDEAETYLHSDKGSKSAQVYFCFEISVTTAGNYALSIDCHSGRFVHIDLFPFISLTLIVELQPMNESIQETWVVLTILQELLFKSVM